MSLVVAIMLAVILGACGIPEPTQDAVLDEGYLAYPGATKTKQDFRRGLRGGQDIDGGESSYHSTLYLTYWLDRPTPRQDIWNWYDGELKVKGWTSEHDGSYMRYKKQVGNRVHGIAVRPLAESSDTKFERYEVPQEGAMATHYSVTYTIGFER